MPDKPMAPAEAADVLQAHNEWRRGAIDSGLRGGDPVSPGALGLAIDVAIEQLRALARKEEKLERVDRGS